MPITSGSYTVGPAAGDYASLSAAVADISGPLSGDLTFTVIEDYTETAMIDFSAKDLNGYTLTCTGDTAHNGDFASGRVVSWYSSTLFFVSDPPNSSAGSVLIISNLNLRLSGANCRRAIDINIASSLNDITVDVHDILADYRNGTASYRTAIEFATSGSHNTWVYNCIVLESKSLLGSGAIEVSSGGVTGTIENCVVLDSGGNSPGFNSASGAAFTGTVRNCVAINCAGACFSGFSGATGQNNMSDDATAGDGNWGTGTGNFPSITALSEFKSVTVASSDFMMPTNSGNAKNGGAAVSISGNDHGITLTSPRPHSTYYSVGAQETPSVPVFVTPPITEVVATGASASFTVVADYALSYQWQYRLMGGSVWIDISGETSTGYTTDPTVVGDHGKRIRCLVEGYGDSAGSLTAYILIIGEPIYAEVPDRPTAVVASIIDRTITVRASGDGDIYRAEILDMANNLVASSERVGDGEFTIVVPRRGVRYTLTVVAGNTGSPAAWSLPGLSISILIPPLAIASEEPGIGVSSSASTSIKEAGPLGAGLAFPFRFSETTGAPSTNYGEAHVVDGMKQVLMTRLNERSIRRDFGSAIAGRLFAPDVQIGPDVSANIQMALTNFEHRSEVTRIVFTRDRVHGKIFADIKYRIYRTHQEGNLVYPFAMEV